MIRNAYAEADKAAAAALAAKIAEHRHDGAKCKPACAELTEMRAELRRLRGKVRAWFEPPPEQAALF